MSIGASVPISTRAWLSCTSLFEMSSEFCAASTAWIANTRSQYALRVLAIVVAIVDWSGDLVVLLRDAVGLQRRPRRVDLEAAQQRLVTLSRETVEL